MRSILGCLAVILLAGCGGGGGGGGGGDVGQVESAASMLAAPVYADCGAPTIDGKLGAGEWDRAVKVRFAANLPVSIGGGFVPAEVQAMSDDENLYVAFRILGDVAILGQSHTVEIDADGDGMPSNGDDGFGFSCGGWFPEDVAFRDGHRAPCISPDDGQHYDGCGFLDQAPAEGTTPGTNDGGAAYGFGADEVIIEEWHPYTGKDPLDVMRQVGQRIEMKFAIRLLEVACKDTEAAISPCISDSYFPHPQSAEDYRPFVLGCGAADPTQEVVELRVGDGANAALPTIQLGSSDPVVATVLGSERLDASKIDPASVWLAGGPVALKADGTHASKVEDVNGDGLLDFVAEFAARELKVAAGAPEVSIAGRTVSGQRFHGTDGVQVTGP